MKKVILQAIAWQLVFGLLLINPALIARAEEVPNKEELRQNINEQTNESVQNNLNDSTSESQQTEVTNTGDNTSVDQNSESNTDTSVQNTNNTAINQNVNAEANTGNNEASKNISFGGNAGVIITGDAAVGVQGSVNTNNNPTYIAPAEGTVGQSTQITNTGKGLTSSQSSTNNLLQTVGNKNNTLINQTVNSKANTGGNKAEGNISIGGGQAGLIITGSALTSTNFLVSGNGSVVVIGGASNGNGPGSGASILLLNTGNGSRLGFYSQRETRMMAQNKNYASVNQNVNAYANTGYNSADRNIGTNGDAGIVNTGNAVVRVGLGVNANNNNTSVNSSSGQSGSNTDIINTGDNSQTHGNNNSNTQSGVNNSNYLGVDQNVYAYANTGHNTANRNISFGGNAGVIRTGDAVILVGLQAQGNNNETQIDLGNSSSVSNTGYQPCYGSTSTLNAVNTGDSTSFDQNNNSNTDINVNNTNTLKARQNINSHINTGENDSDNNIGSTAGIVNTGNAVVQAGMAVSGNTNNTEVGCQIAQANPVPTAPPTVTQPPSKTTTKIVNRTRIIARNTTTISNSSNNPSTTSSNNSSSNSGPSSSSSSSTQSSVSSGDEGEVLGVSVSRLPRTGTGLLDILVLLLSSLVVLIGGIVSSSHAGRFYNFINEKGGANNK